MVNIASQIGVLKSDQAISAAEAGEIITPATLTTYLVANGYTAAQVALMNENDKIFAWRQKTSQTA